MFACLIGPQGIAVYFVIVLNTARQLQTLLLKKKKKESTFKKINLIKGKPLILMLILELGHSAIYQLFHSVEEYNAHE